MADAALTSNLVAELREAGTWPYIGDARRRCNEAANEIDRLTARVAELEKELQAEKDAQAPYIDSTDKLLAQAEERSDRDAAEIERLRAALKEAEEIISRSSWCPNTAWSQDEWNRRVSGWLSPIRPAVETTGGQNG